jgi:polysaccharide export outer membrane protein
MRTATNVALFAAVLVGSALAQEQAALVTTNISSYTLRPGDVLQIRVWGQDEFSGQFQIDETGHFLYPVLGQIDTQSLSIGQLRDSLRAGLETIFNRPFVTVTPRFRISVLGHVQTPGLYTVDPTLTAIDVVALAGGPTSNGNLNDIRLLRPAETERIDYNELGPRGLTLSEVGVRSGDQIYVPRRAFTRQDLTLVLQIAQIALTLALLISTL